MLHRAHPAPRRRPVLAAAAVAAAVALSPFGAAHAQRTKPAPRTPAAAQPGVVTFGIQPADKGKPGARPFLTYSATPGAELTDAVAVVNPSRQPLTLRVYAADAVNAADGSFGLRSRNERAVDLGAWITLRGPKSVKVAPGKHVIVPLSLKIPKNASPGDHVAGVVVSLTARGRNKEGAAVDLEQRVATRVYLRVSGEVQPSLGVSRMKVRYTGGNPAGTGRARVSYVVTNTGNIVLGGRQSLAVSGLLGGTGESAAIPDLPQLLPGGSVPVTVDVTGIRPAGRMTARVTIAPLTMPGAPHPTMRPAQGAVRFWTVPWLLLAALLVLSVAVWRVVRRRRRANPPMSPPSGDPTFTSSSPGRLAHQQT